ncbi:3-dehydroquinate synthase [Leptospira ryugenii]|uniref:3-dehydroquinate synthase n=1 Tax=Leptospira ryugenii TaxID=1917863 RepID=A0A2P2E1D8_9LEPT|nr:3-dehydroquinate synthase [Leptospira ryugenii]GBF50699.1 3-dehydroquinate synthase [Leptospira ryugenii]
MMLRSREVKGSHFSYPVELHEDFQGLRERLTSLPKVSSIIIITNRKIAGIYEKYIVKELRDSAIPFHILYTKEGEKNKHIDRVKKIYHELIKLDIDRKAVLVAFGGGVVGDFVGFIAATYQRGVRFVQVPTSLLASVDSSVGGKVAVNLDMGKNMVGAFHQPEFVFAPIFTLSTLPKKEWSCGLAEITKHAFLDAGPLLTLLEKAKRSDFQPKSSALLDSIDESVRIKSLVVGQDERETGLRAILNLGHTTGHAIESLTKYKKYSHGEAVSIGIMTALLLSRELLHFPEASLQRAIRVMKALELPLQIKENPEDILKHMFHDKKREGNQLKFVLLEDFGKPKFGITVGRDQILKTLLLQKGMKELG